MKKKKGGGGGGANWMDTYGDMVTLLLCFFVLLFSMSTISEEKWRALATSFNPNAVETPTATPGGSGPNADFDDGTGGPLVPETPDEGLTQDKIDQQMEDLYKAILEYVSKEHKNDTISVFKENGKVFITFNETVFFDGDSPVLRKESYPILDTISEILGKCAEAVDEVRVVGHTAQAHTDRPNTTRVDRTLSSMRATNVVIYIQEQERIDPGRLVSEGVGQWRPIANNDTAEGRAKNRRVEMIISGRNLEQELAGGIKEFEVVK